MIWLIIALIAAIASIIAIVRDDSIGQRFFACCFVTFCLLGAAMIVNATCSAVLSFVADTQWTLSQTRNITALNDTTAATGRFFLGSGRVEEEMHYYFIEDTEKGKAMDSISADNAYIIESDTEAPRIETWTKQWTNKDVMFWFTIIPPNGSEYKIYIPQNSVTTNFFVDLGNGTLTPGATTTSPTKAPTSNQCAHCNHTLSEADNFCPSCGTPATLPAVYCASCGREAGIDEKFCPNCGAKIESPST